MKRSPIALALAAAIGVAVALPSAPVLAQAGASATVMPIRTGSSAIDGAFGVRLAVYDARSFELFWNRIPNAASYRVQVGGRTVQDDGGLSRYVSGVNLSGGFDYTLTALDRAGAAIAVRRFRVQPASGAQLVEVGGTVAPTTPTAPATPTTPTVPATGPIRTGTSNLGGDFPVRLAVYDARSFELSWQRVPGAASYRLSRDGRVVQESDGISRYVSGIDGSASFAYTLAALDRSGNALRSASFTVSPRAPSQLVAGGTASVPATPTAPAAPTAPVAPATPAAPGEARESSFLPETLAAPLLAPIEPGSPLSVANHETFVRAFYGIAEPRVLDELLRRTEAVQAELRDAADGAASRFVAESVAPAGGAASETVFACPDGGTVGITDGPALDGAGTETSGALMDFRQCALGADTLSGITRETPVGRSDRTGTNRTFGGYRLGIARYPFMPEAVGLGAEGERFTVSTEAGPDASVFGRVVRTLAAFPDGITLENRSWRGNWRLERPGATLLVTNLIADASRWSEDSEDGDRSKPYFTVAGTVTNGREITTVNQSDFVEIRRSGLGVAGDQAFRDARGGVMDLVAGPDDETGEQRTRVRVDTAGTILNRTLPDALEATPYLTDR